MRPAEKTKKLKMHPKYAYITEHCDRLRGRDIEKEIGTIIKLFLDGKYALIGKGREDAFWGEGYHLANSGKRALIWPDTELYRLFEVAWDEYQELPLMKALK